MLTLQDMDLSTVDSLPANTQQLTVSNCSNLDVLPKLMSSMPTLTHLAVDHTSLSSLPELSHSTLTSLNLGGCTALRTLAASLAKTLPQLQDLNLSGARSLQRLSGNLGCLDQLKTLDLSGCQSLTDLPDSIGDLTALTALDVHGCSSLAQMPSYTGNLKSLKVLDLSGCARLAGLPRSLDRLRSLETLDLSGCVRLGFIPEKVLRLSGLTIRLEGCTRLEQIMSEVLPSHAAAGKQEEVAVFSVETAPAAAAAALQQAKAIRRGAAAVTAAAAEPLLGAARDMEASFTGTLSNSSKQQLSQMQRQCRRVYKLVHYPTRYLRPLEWLAIMLVIVAVVAVSVAGIQLPMYWLYQTQTHFKPAESMAASQSLNHTSSYMAAPQSANNSQVSSEYTVFTGNYTDGYITYDDDMQDMGWTDETQSIRVPVVEFPGVRRFKIIQVFIALPFIMKALLGAVITAVVSALSGLVLIALTYTAAHKQAWLNKQHKQQRALTPEAVAGRFWLLLVLSYSSSCVAITACYCAVYIGICETMLAKSVLAASYMFGGVVPMMVWLLIPGVSVLGLGMLWIVEDMGRLFPGWSAVSAGVRAGCFFCEPVTGQ